MGIKVWRTKKAITIVFKVFTENNYNTPVYITGNHDKLGNWAPAAVPLEKQSEQIWSGQFSFRKNTRLQFKFTRGSWQSEALDKNGRTFSNRELTVKHEVTETIHIPAWKKKPAAVGGQMKSAGDKPENRTKGSLKIHRQMKGEGLPPRDIIVWLPPGYDANPETRYPVLYMHDGQNVFDPGTSYTGVAWGADRTAIRLMDEGRMKKIIIIGIYNTENRVEEYSASPAGERYMKFLTETLKPFIDITYRTLSNRENTATLGSSMGGLISFLLAWDYSHIFSQAGCLSPSFIYKEGQAIKRIKKSGVPRQRIRIYMDCGGVGGEKLLYPGCKRVLRILRKKKLKPGDDFRFYYDKTAGHSEQAWGNRLWRHFLFMFGTAESAGQ